MQNNNTATPTNPSTPNQPGYIAPKSSVTAGLLGIFLGGLGAHDWYLGDTKKGTIHLCLLGGGLLLTIISAALTAVTAFVLPILAAIFGLLTGLAYLVLLGNSVWGLVDGIILLAQGDAGLAAKGYPVASAALYNPSQVSNPVTPAGETVKATDNVDDDTETQPASKPTAKSDSKSASAPKPEKSSKKSDK